MSFATPLSGLLTLPSKKPTLITVDGTVQEA